MISIYRVLLLGERFFLNTNEGLIPHGFYRNEYVFASTVDEAVAIATKRAMKKLRKKNVTFMLNEPPQIIAEKVESKMPIWRLIRNEGFIFFREEKFPDLLQRDKN